MDEVVFRNLSRNNDSFLERFWGYNLGVLISVFLAILDFESIIGWFWVFLICLSALVLLNSIYFVQSYYSGYIVDDEGITKFTLTGKKKYRSWKGVIKVGTFKEEIHKNSFPSGRAIRGGMFFNTTLIYLSPFFPRDNGEYLQTHPDVFIFHYRKDLYNLVVEKIKQHNPETQGINSL